MERIQLSNTEYCQESSGTLKIVYYSCNVAAICHFISFASYFPVDSQFGCSSFDRPLSMQSISIGFIAMAVQFNVTRPVSNRAAMAKFGMHSGVAVVCDLYRLNYSCMKFIKWLLLLWLWL